MTPPGPRPFAVEVVHRGGTSVLVVAGEVDLVTAPELGRLAGAAIDRGCRHLVLDLGQVDFLGAAGAGVVAAAVYRLAALGGEVEVRAAPSLAQRVLEVTGLAERARVPGPPGALVTADDEPAELVHALTRIGAVPASDHLLYAALGLVVALATATVGGADGASVSLRRRRELATVASTDETVRAMDGHQYESGEGPCISASSEGRSFHVESLGDERRWPRFTPKAVAQGISSILSTPLLTPVQPVGALNIYSRTAHAFGTADQALASLLAAETSAIVADALLEVPAVAVTERLHEALRAREVIAQAQGVLMARSGLSPEEAFAQLRRYSRRTNVPLGQRAAEVVASAQTGGRGAALPLGEDDVPSG